MNRPAIFWSVNLTFTHCYLNSQHKQLLAWLPSVSMFRIAVKVVDTTSAWACVTINYCRRKWRAIAATATPSTTTESGKDQLL
jgi:hypothetical protein